MPHCRFPGKSARHVAALASVPKQAWIGLIGRRFLVAGVVLAFCFGCRKNSATAAGESSAPKNGPTDAGTSFMLRIQPRKDADDKPMPVTPKEVDQAIKVIEKRLEGAGISEWKLQVTGNDGIVVRLPGVDRKEADNIRVLLEKVAKLELHEVSPRSEEPGPDGKSLAARVLEGAEIVPGCKAYIYKHKYKGKEIETPILLRRMTALGGKDISLATPSQQQIDAVSITLNSDGTDKMIALTKNMTPQKDRIAIVLDGEVISAPVVNQVPLGKQFVIDGLRDPGEVGNLAKALMNPLENALWVEEVRTTSAPPASN